MNIHDCSRLIIATNPRHNECKCAVIILHRALPPFPRPVIACVCVCACAWTCSCGCQGWLLPLTGTSSADRAVATHHAHRGERKRNLKGKEGKKGEWKQERAATMTAKFPLGGLAQNFRLRCHGGDRKKKQKNVPNSLRSICNISTKTNLKLSVTLWKKKKKKPTHSHER